MKNKIKERVLLESKYMLKTGDTIRKIAKKHNISKSTVHKDLKERLKQIDLELYKEVNKVIKHHIKTRHIKGGLSTKKKYLKMQ
ncbi:MAG: sporulation transcriptional regulator SpoIIID [Bacilli bacterium]|nr:sporulation transcriptional regulator SpoIIID [Bacilli bacterium]